MTLPLAATRGQSRPGRLSAGGVNVTWMKLEMMAGKDVELRLRLQTDPQLMTELGGSRPREAIERAHARSLALAAEGKCWPLRIIPTGESSPAGGVDVFESSHDGEPIYEIGWMILPEFQNRGIASQAVRKVLEWQPLAGRPVLKPSGSSQPRAATSLGGRREQSIREPRSRPLAWRGRRR